MNRATSPVFGMTALASLAVLSTPTQSNQGPLDVAGRVIDQGDRALPFVVVTSRTGNGFLSVYTDLDGRFAFPGRPHRPGNTLQFQSAGFKPLTAHLTAGVSDVQARLETREVPAGSGWTVGLAAALEVQVLSVDGAVADPTQLLTGESYTLSVASFGPLGCSRPGPSAINVNGTSVTVAVAEFVRNRDCGATMVRHDRTFEVSFGRSGPGWIRMVGRYQDIVVPITVTSAQPPHR